MSVYWNGSLLNVKDLSGILFDGWVVIEFSRRIKSGSGKANIDYWAVECVTCHRRKEFQGSGLLGGKVAICTHETFRTIEQLQPPDYLPIPGYRGYVAGKDGSIWSGHISGGVGGIGSEWRMIPPKHDKDGYVVVTLSRIHSKVITRRVAHCILEAFVGPCPSGMESCHFPDVCRDNNAVENLRWDSHINNINDKIICGTVAMGVSHGCCKITEDTVREIREIRKTTGATYKTIGNMFGIDPGHAWDIVKRNVWKHI